MELVYLWVDSYKNIEKQGFNFSPRFEFEYIQEKNELMLKKENKDYVSIFPPNINVTAIVGENGSGKSGILEILTQLSYEKDIKNIGLFLYLLKEGDNYQCFSYGLEVKFEFTNCTNKLLHKYEMDADREHDKVKIAITNLLNIAYLNISHFERDKIIKNDEQGDLDKLIYLGIYNKHDFDKNKTDTPTASFPQYNPSNFYSMQIQRVISLMKMPKYKDLIVKYLNIKSIYSLSVSYDKEKLTKQLKNIVDDSALDITIEDTKKLEEYLEKKYFIIDNDEYSELFKLINSIFKNQGVPPFKYTLNSPSNTPINLSAGENTILFYIDKLGLLFDRIEKKSTVLLFDEIELYLHPNWQKKLLSIVLDIFKIETLTKNMHVVFVSHSPFLLSDLPKENVIFLEKNENGNCKNVTSKTNIDTFGANIHTLLSDGFFMQDGLMGEFAKGKITAIKDFYDEVKKSKNPKNEHKQEFKNNIENFRHIQSIIGEPFLKTIMKNYLDELELIFSDDEDLINKELEALEKRKLHLEKLKNAKN